MIRKLYALTLAVIMCLSVVALASGDTLGGGQDNQRNALFGEIVYSRPSCFDGTYWDVWDCNAASNPWYVVEVAPTLDDDYVTGTIALDSSSAQFTLPEAGGDYVVCAVGNTAYIKCGTNPTVSIAAGGYVLPVPEGTCLGPMKLTGPKCAHIAASAAGYITFAQF